MSDRGGERVPRGIVAGIGLCSLAVLMAEVLLTRIFSFAIWYHLAYLTLSTALLGFGAAGSILSAFPRLLEDGLRRRLALWSAASGIALLAALALLAPRPLDPDRLLEEPVSFFFGLFGYYVLVLVPFVLAGLSIAAPLSRWASRIDRLYAADLLGAGFGCLAAVAALTWMDGPAAMVVCAALFAGAGALYAGAGGLRVGLAGLGVVLLALSPQAERMLEFTPAPSKQLAKNLARPGTELLHSEWSAVNRVDLYRVPGARGGLWGGFGLNPFFDGEIPRVLDIQYDGHNGSNVFEVRGPESLRMLDSHILRSPYLLVEKPKVLAIGVGGGIDILNALHQGASSVTGVELQPITVRLHHTLLKNWTGGMFQRPEVTLVAAEGRHFVRSSGEIYDLIQITAVDTFSAQSTGAYVLAESYLYTVEAFRDFLAHLEPDGVLSLVLGDWMYADKNLPSPLATRLALVARRALEENGIADAPAHIMLVAQPFDNSSDGPVVGSMMGALLVKKQPFTKAEIERMRAFANANFFTLRLDPGGEGDISLSRIVHAPASEMESVLASQPFAIEPVTDARPFFYHVLRWSSLLGDERILWIFPGSTTGQIVLVMMLVQALILGTALIVFPLLRGARQGLSGRRTWGFLGYFLGLGVGFMLIEISFIQKYVLLLGYPTYSLSVTLASLLFATALGAALSRRAWGRARVFLVSILAVTVCLVALETLLVPVLRDALLEASLAVRIAATVLFQLPLGLCLGMYFPTGIELLHRHHPRLVAWAWGVNGLGSVVSSVLAVMVAMAIGFEGVAWVALALYVMGTTGLLLSLPGSEADRVLGD